MSARRIAWLSLLVLTNACVARSGSVRPQGVEQVSAEPIPADLRENVERAERIGFLLYIFDKAAWIGTDVLREHVGTLEDAGIGGYLPLREGDEDGPKDSFLVWFFTNDDPVKIAYRIRVFIRPGRQSEFEAFNPPQPTPSGLALLIKARQAAIKAVPDIVQPLNPELFPGEIDNEHGILVYLLAGTTQSNRDCHFDARHGMNDPCGNSGVTLWH